MVIEPDRMPDVVQHISQIAHLEKAAARIDP
jgi:hypothetical protein